MVWQKQVVGRRPLLPYHRLSAPITHKDRENAKGKTRLSHVVQRWDVVAPSTGRQARCVSGSNPKGENRPLFGLVECEAVQNGAKRNALPFR
ncbi:MAG TPA: hypothetical protein DEB45_08815 [Alteromonas australica]|uniref:Uncharacterized protein n=1 Tax=Alteromonas australica TaxID=589873 RepID=A0A358DYJ5_9ALTE|nr:hypothetical protein [Alteromonas australica]